MSNLTNDLYRANPAFREELEVHARELRRQEFKRLVIQPLVNAWKRAVNRGHRESMHRVSESV